ncbi:CopG family transcriptional regulator [Listeria fleischmannii FSL S10-1203]|uniref:CopG family transcriptional regulator n=1 Tax=Listeria fleischmannii FSL S10-1203 TaxID=1265822 RepID=W7DBE3_9LIST|nr:CopG family transcriptional regulator [Listeria fleischmannii FSL S10-1203]
MLEREQHKEISVVLSQEVIEELDRLVIEEKVERSEVIMEATQEFLKQKKSS